MIHHQVSSHCVAGNVGSYVLDLVSKARVAFEQAADVFEVALYRGRILDCVCRFAFKVGLEDAPWVAVSIKHASVQRIVHIADDLFEVGGETFERDSRAVAVER